MSRLRHLPMSKLAYHDPLFMESLPARPLRILAEYLDPLSRMRRENIADTIVMFGSARIKSREQTEETIKQLKRAGMKTRASRGWRERMRMARAALGMSRYYEEARELSRRITEWSLTLGTDPRRFVICSGGGPGIMEAANRGAYEAGGTSIGLSIQLPHEQRPNPYITPALNICFHYFFMRKLWFAQMAKALIVFPGGFGTMDELWEMLTLLQTGKLSSHHMILIYGRKYWDKVINWQTMVRAGTMNDRELKLLKFADSVDEAFEKLREDLKHRSVVTTDWPLHSWPTG
ncbi:MAG TPA: TIGR00730 family Rossman fold protein [Candidatus Acidoferrales bacterium]|nr:TIGR00730 family Rossman fold protein [Candidatus Acidoferrales bacterium]